MLVRRRVTARLRSATSKGSRESRPLKSFQWTPICSGVASHSTRTDKTNRGALLIASPFVVMRERGVRDTLTTDGDFEQAGFNALLRE